MKLIPPPIQEKLKKFQHTYSASLDSVENMTDDLVDIINFFSTTTTSASKKKLRKREKEVGREKNNGIQSERNLNGLSIGLKRISENIPSK